ncbi:MAG: zinc ABC transporter substrate-binding protein [Myxococcota bacterium]
MKLILSSLLATAFVWGLPTEQAQAKTKIVVTYPYIESLVRQVAKDQVSVTTLAKGNEDPHFVVPRPSFIGKLRQADLLILNGASLEIGFLPPLIQRANNPRIVPGAPGFIDLSQHVELIDKPSHVSRSEGDIHPQGNPHFILDWHNVPAVARAISDALGSAVPKNKQTYQSNLATFLAQWEKQSEAWDSKARSLQTKKVRQYHRLFNYFTKRASMEIVGELEPKPGIPPTSRHLEELIEANSGGGLYLIIADVYHEQRSAEGVAHKLNVPWVVLPQDVGAVENASDIFHLYDDLIGRSLR